jgi:hypothetical protein
MSICSPQHPLSYPNPYFLIKCISAHCTTKRSTPFISYELEPFRIPFTY